MNDSLLTGNADLFSDAALWKGMGVLMLVLALFLGLVYLLKRFQKGAGGSGLDLEVVGRVGLAPKQYLSVVRVGKEHWVIGVTDASIRYIGEYHASDQGAPAMATRPQSGRTSFTQTLDKTLRRIGKPFGRTRSPIEEQIA